MKNYTESSFDTWEELPAIYLYLLQSYVSLTGKTDPRRFEEIMLDEEEDLGIKPTEELKYSYILNEKK